MVSAEPDEHLLAEGERLGKFVVTRLIGRGGMGAVYEAHDPDLARRVAVKILRAPGGGNGGLRLLREAQTLAQLSHPNVVAVHEVGVADQGFYIAMELIDGETLDAYLRRRKPDRRAILDLFVQAGRGLAAAHGRQIVHRDFKPGNVIVDREGRVRVTDFGLARQADELPPGTATATPTQPEPAEAPVDGTETTEVRPSSRPSTPAPALRGLQLTMDGAVVGTPRYMPPELRARRPATPRSDQYSFCVSLWEALFGAHPLAPDRRPRAPRWLVRALSTGLDPDPARRFASMAELLEILERTPVRRRRLVYGAAAIAVAAIAIAGTAALSARRRVDCRRAGDGIDAVWDAAARARVGGALASARPGSAALGALVGADLDAWAGGWRAARVDTCRATHERGEQSPAMLDRVGACLDDQLGELRALVGQLFVADGAAADRVLDAVRALPGPPACSAARVGDRALPDPRGAEARRLLDETLAAQRLGNTGAATRSAAAAVAAAGAVADPALRARALALQGEILGGTDAPQAHAALDEALVESARAGDRDVALFVATRYLDRLTTEAGTERIETFLPIERAALAAAGASSPHRLEATVAEARALMQVGKYDDSDAACTQVAGLEPPPAVQAATCRCINALARRVSGDVAPCHELVELATRRYGPDHDLTARARLREATGLAHAGKYADAVAVARRGLAALEASGDDDGAARAHYIIGQNLYFLDRFAEARPELERSMALNQRLGLGPSQRLANDHEMLARTVVRLGDRAAARTEAEAALGMSERILGAEHPDMIIHLLMYGETAQRIGEAEGALRAYQRAAALAERSFPPGHVLAGNALLFEADVLLDLRRPAQALPLAERAAAILDAAHGDPYDVARAHHVLARALVDTGDRARGRREALDARDRYGALGAPGLEGIGQVDALLRR